MVHAIVMCTVALKEIKMHIDHKAPIYPNVTPNKYACMC